MLTCPACQKFFELINGLVCEAQYAKGNPEKADMIEPERSRGDQDNLIQHPNPVPEPDRSTGAIRVHCLNDPDSLLNDCRMTMNALAKGRLVSRELDTALADVLHCLHDIVCVFELLLVFQADDVDEHNRLIEEGEAEV